MCRLVLCAIGLAVSSPASAEVYIQYYWELEVPAVGLSWERVPPRLARFGWSDNSSIGFPVGPVVQVPGESLWSYCARQVGRALRQDVSPLQLSTAMTDACVRNGGTL